ncbi:ABC transporter ATP-binding protein [Methylobacterium sp. Leaf399]|uniref:ABC transporter ATP-binding protein n=1 Tax=unclassified Methylobacterium TaxID=2615210 RepID=UPI00070214F3|nr:MULTISPECIES: phosphate ABC transporter ATP-binding protein [unclassified Methylobacterium]KQP60645.1 ABC transporter ATP-binding protein [Methylobacterium sp. Leaf108]KQT19877.1 ABC transporter ATP-binding protein [Methylobacterium sp. Leaf399]KQT78398.1 ABC transporter ATP-binding protein [Methylobacterium sp. Leaf466]
MSGPAAIVRLAGLRYEAGGRTILDGLDLTLEGTGITALVGPNGAGKSVTLRMIDGLLAPQAGTVETGALRRAFVFQRPPLVRTSAARNVALALAPLGLSGAERRARVAQALARVGLLDRAGDPAPKLSGGEQQRLALARAWATRPGLLLLDEPTASLDPAATATVETLVAEMAAEGIAVVLVSHNLAQVARLAEHVVVLAAGRVVEQGPVRQVLGAPRSAQARAYIKGEFSWESAVAAS